MSFHIIIFLVSLLCITLELFLTRILNLKTWNHVVYVIIPFALLGYGIGANIYLIFRNKIQQFPKNEILSQCLKWLGILTFSCTLALVYLPIHAHSVVTIFTNIGSLHMLLVAYLIVMLPFIFIGFIVVYLFSENPQSSHTLYFFDLLGAGLGAYLFFPLISSLAVVRSILLLALMALLASLLLRFPQRKLKVAVLGVPLSLLIVLITPEPKNYAVDPSKGWEWVPGNFPPHTYQTLLSSWHPLGRTDIYRITDTVVSETLYHNNFGTFELNVDPLPEFSYISANFLAGTPIYKFSKEGMAEKNSEIKLFSQAMEVPYVLLNNPRVVVIGTGGGRDIFMAHTHQAQEIIGAEINPGTFRAMSPGGKMFEYSGQVYSRRNTRVINVDGRHLVKTLKPNQYDLILLNGVDTFSGLSTGAYAYAESYLYTKNAVLDYLKILKDGGIINFNRWFSPELPREDLRLEAIVLDALKDFGAEKPWEHIMMGGHKRWCILLVKKTAFTKSEKDAIRDYFQRHDTDLAYPTLAYENKTGEPISYYDLYADAFQKNLVKPFVSQYPYDISVITDDSPFFYKYYKWQSFNPFKVIFGHHQGNIIFMSQLLIFMEALLFIILFIFLPLSLSQNGRMSKIPQSQLPPFILYFSCLGAGFMFIEIPYMQKFTLLLGSPIHSISVTLAILLVATGLGSFLLPSLEKAAKTKESLITLASIILVLLLIFFEKIGPRLFDQYMGSSFLIRILLVSLSLLPIGLCLGIFFPTGLIRVSHNEGAVAWAWGLNCGFSVLGSILAIILAQFLGFQAVILLACVLYLIALLVFKRMIFN